MRYVLAAAIIITFPALATGQQAPAPVPPPSIGLPLPPIGLPLPPIGLDTSIDQPPPVISPKPPGPGGRPHPPRPAFIFYGAPYAFGVDPALQSKWPGEIVPVPKESPPPTTGIVRLDVEPRDLAQVFVDGDYVGTPADLEGGLELEPGTRRIEIRARGYESLTFDVRVVAGRTITYRETLNRAGGAGEAGGAGRAGGVASKEAAPNRPADPTGPSPTSPSRPKTTFYLIPGCYLGNVPPDQVKLPANCDFSRMITHTP
jgi:hypothetical protein